LFILDSAASQIVRVEPDAQHSYDPAGALAAGRISQVDLNPLGLGTLRGLAFNPSDGRLYILNPAELKLYEITQDGQLVSTRELSNLDLTLQDPQGIVFAPSGDITDDPAQMNLFLMDSGLDSTATGGPYNLYLPLIVKEGQEAASPSGQPTAPGASTEGGAAAPKPGRLIEFTLTAPPQIPSSINAQATVGTLIRAINAFQWSPPSPDSSGLAYLPDSGTILVSDGEVNEMPIFTGKNLFQSSLSGTLVNTLTTISFSDEPAGAEVNPVKRSARSSRAFRNPSMPRTRRRACATW
jgi:hypothetical protein